MDHYAMKPTEIVQEGQTAPLIPLQGPLACAAADWGNPY
jgi:hypothetical protein